MSMRDCEGRLYDDDDESWGEEFFDSSVGKCR